jgi:hypothetical protein
VFLSFGIQQLTQPEAMPALEAYTLAARMEAVAKCFAAAARTPSGSYWASRPDQMPEALAVGEMVATPAGIVAQLGGGTLALDIQEGELQLLAEGGKGWSVSIDRKGLAELAPAWASALIPLATSEPGAVFDLPLGLALERSADGDLFVTGGGIRLGLTAGEGFQLSGELASLLASRLRMEGQRALALNQTLAATPAAPVEAAR